MSLNIGRALQDGIERTLSRSGAVLLVVWFVVAALNQVAYNSAVASLLPPSSQQPPMLGPTMPLSPAVGWAAVLLLYLASFVLTAVALRTFASEETRTIPREYVTRNIGWFLVNYFVGYLVFLLAVWIGMLLLVVPGVFLLVSLYFWIAFVAVEDQNFVEAFGNAWDLARGNRWSLLGLGLIVTVAGTVLYGVLFFVGALVSPWASLVAVAAAVAAFGVFGMAVTARAYVQLRSESEEAAAADAAAPA